MNKNYIFNQSSNTLVKCATEPLIRRLDAEAELYEIETKKVGHYIDLNLSTMTDYKSFKKDALIKFIKNEQRELESVLKKIEARKLLSNTHTKDLVDEVTSDDEELSYSTYDQSW